MVHNTSAGSEDDVAELTRGKQLDNPLLKVLQGDVVAGRDDTSLVETSIELDHDLAVAVVIDFLEFANVAYQNQSQQRRCWVGEIVAIE